MARWDNAERTPLALLRVKAGFTRAEAAVLMQLGMITLARYESGMNDVPFGIGEQMASLYNVPFEDIRKAVMETKKNAGYQPVGRPKRMKQRIMPKVVLEK